MIYGGEEAEKERREEKLLTRSLTEEDASPNEHLTPLEQNLTLVLVSV